MFRNHLAEKAGPSKLSFVTLAMTIVALLFSMSMPVSTMAASDVTLHMHGGVGLIFEFHFTTPEGADLVYSVPGDTLGQGAPTDLTNGDILEYVLVYVAEGAKIEDGKVVSATDDPISPIDRIEQTQIAHRDQESNPGVKLTDDGSFGSAKGQGVLESNNGKVNFWYSGGVGETMFTVFGEKSVTGMDAEHAAGLFTFTLKEGTSVVATATNDADGYINFPALRFDKVGAHTYTVTEDADPDLTGWTFDKTSYDVTINVVEGQSVGGYTLLTATATYPKDGIVFNNTFTPEPPAIHITPAPLVITGTKIVEGTDEDVAGWFEFGLYDEEGNPISTATNAADGSITFPAIDYKNADDVGTHTYIVMEDGMADESRSDANWEFDYTPYIVTVTVTKNADDVLSASAVTTIEGEDDPVDLVFTNTYEKPATKHKKVTPLASLPTTGDASSFILPCALLIVAIAASVVITQRRKNQA